MEIIYLSVFAASVLACVLAGKSILAAMAFGYGLFFLYGILRRYSVKDMLLFSVRGMRAIKNILVSFVLIGILTAVWRACGSISYIVYHASAWCLPSMMVLFTFLLCSLISFLTGTAFGSAATIGVICAAMAAGMGFPARYIGGAVLSGVFFGDRCSPVSTSALLVSELTKTELLSNMKTMVKTSAVPFGLACVAYLLLGRSVVPAANAGASAAALFETHYALSALTLLPVAAVLVLSLCRVGVKTTLAVSALLGAVLAVTVQKMPVAQLPALFLYGFRPSDPALAKLMGGGGVASMISVFCIVCLSSCYAGIFQGTSFLNGVQKGVQRMARAMSNMETTALIALVTAGVSCNQTLSIMLTHQLCKQEYEDPAALAADLENTAVVIPPLIPWSIASGVPLAAVGAPIQSIAFAFYLFLIPLWNILVGRRRMRKKTR